MDQEEISAVHGPMFENHCNPFVDIQNQRLLLSLSLALRQLIWLYDITERGQTGMEGLTSASGALTPKLVEKGASCRVGISLGRF